MAQPQRPANVHQDELSPSNKHYALMAANKKIYLDNPLRIFHLPQATNNNHERFVVAPKFSEMVPFFLNTLGFTMDLRSPSNFKTTRLVQPWQALSKIFSRCYIVLARDKYHNLEDDAMVKNVFNSGKHKYNVEMKISRWIITDEMKLTDHYQMYPVVFGVDFPMTQSQPIDSTHGMHRTLSAPRSPNPETDEGESSALRKSTIIRLCIPQRRSTRLTRPTLMCFKSFKFI
ncbi:hypothetical protein Tco_0962937 [Tanacetum coccineum]